VGRAEARLFAVDVSQESKRLPMAPSPRVPPKGLGTSLATGGCWKSSTAAVHRNETAA